MGTQNAVRYAGKRVDSAEDSVAERFAASDLVCARLLPTFGRQPVRTHLFAQHHRNVLQLWAQYASVAVRYLWFFGYGILLVWQTLTGEVQGSR